jgi:hypothetical protein
MKLWQIEAVSAVGVVLGLLIFMRERNAVCGTSTAPVSETIVKACALTMSMTTSPRVWGWVFPKLKRDD